jgi:hypothetical protein
MACVHVPRDRFPARLDRRRDHLYGFGRDPLEQIAASIGARIYPSPPR